MNEFKGKIIVVTGGANGIGRCIVEEFLSLHAFVAFMDIDETAGKILAQKHGDNVLFVCGDVTKEGDLVRFSQEVIRKFGKVDYLINNACSGNGGILSQMGFDAFNQVLFSKITAPYTLTKLFMPHFGDGATVVNIASTRAQQSQQDTESYTAANGGMVALTHALSVSLANRVRVNAISPGWIDTTKYQSSTSVYEPSKEDKLQHPVGRIGHPVDIFNMVKFLCSDASGFITGQNFTVDGGMSKLMVYHGDEGWMLNESEIAEKM